MSDQKPEQTPDRDAVEAAEAAAQRSVCNIPDGAMPADLKKALARRVEVNLEHALEHGSVAVRRIGGSDPEVRRLEAPYSKRVARATTEPAPKRRSAPKPRGRQSRPAKKAAPKKAATTPKGSN